MFCQKCGSQNPDGGKFCQSCGAPMPVIGQRPPQPSQPVGGYAQPASQQPGSQQFVPQQPAPAAYRPQRPEPALPTNPVHALLFRLVSGGLFLTGAIAYTSSLLFKLIAAFSAGSLVSRIFDMVENAIPYSAYGMYDMDGIEAMMDIYSGAVGASAIFTTILSMVPSILIAISMWLVFCSVRRNDGTPIGTAGFTIIKVITIIKVVANILLLLGGETLLCVLAVGLADSVSDDSTTIVLVVVMLVVAAVSILGILYSLKIVATLNTMRDTVVTMRPSDDVSTYVAIYTFILAFFGLFSIILSGGAFGALSVLAMIVAEIAFGIFLLTYKKNMRAMMVGETSYAIHQAAPQPMPQPAQQSNGFQPAPMAVPQPVQQPVPQAAPMAPEANTPRPGETTVLSNGDDSSIGGTTVLSSAPVLTARLVRLKDNTVTMLDRPVTHIGKDPAVDECAITDNSAVSYAHAEILAENGKYYIVDKNSTNHVYMQGALIPPETQCPLESGVEILIANEPFRFELV